MKGHTRYAIKTHKTEQKQVFRGLEESQTHSFTFCKDIILGLDGLYITENTVDGTSHSS